MANQSHLPDDVDTEFYIDSAWTNTYDGEDLAARVRGGDAIRITRGVADQQSAVSPAQSIFTLNNSDGLFTDDNPSSPLFGKFGQNTRVRHGVRDSSGEWDEHVLFCNAGDDSDAQYVVTADKAGLDVTGDIDIRLEFEPAFPRGSAEVLAAKYLLTGDQRSWAVTMLADGTFNFHWSSDGTFSTLTSVNSGTFVRAEERKRAAVRFTLDVNNGASGKTVNFYSSDRIDGTWTLESTLTLASTTSIFSSSAALAIGAGAGGSGIFGGNDQFSGKVYAFEVYDGIGGTLVADFKPYGQGVDAGITSWADSCSTPNTWTLTGGCRLGSDRIRFTGEIASLPGAWDVTGRDVHCPTTAASLLRRLSASGSSLGSAIYRNYRNRDTIYAYWPMEDQAGATQIAVGTSSPNGLPGSFTSCTFGAPDGLDGSSGAITLTSAPNDSKITLRTAGPLTFSGSTGVLFYFKLATLPGSTVTLATITVAGGSVARWLITVSATAYGFTAVARDGSTVDSGTALFGDGASPLDQWIGIQLKMTQESGNVRWEDTWHAVGTETFYATTPGGVTFSGTCGEFSQVAFDTPDSSLQNAQIAHVILASADLDFVTSQFANASKGYAGETAGNRLLRLVTEEGLPFEWVGNLDDTEEVGPQTDTTLYTNMTTAAQVDSGLLAEPRDALGIRYVTRQALGNRRALELDYSQSHLSETPNPVRDDRYLVNDFTANRPSGSSFRYAADDGRRLGVDDPPAGAGRYEQAGSVSVAEDDQLAGQAQWRVFLGTWEERRIPTLSVALHRPEIFSDDDLMSQVLAHDLGDTATLTGLGSSPMPPDDRLLLDLGYTETITGMTWDRVANTVPAGPYQVGILDDEGSHEVRLDASGNTVLDGDVDDDDTTISIKTPDDEPAWINSTDHSSEFNFNMIIEGEVIEVSAATSPSASGGFNLQDLTVTRSVNGVVKSHDDGTAVYLAAPTYLGMGD